MEERGSPEATALPRESAAAVSSADMCTASLPITAPLATQYRHCTHFIPQEMQEHLKHAGTPNQGQANAETFSGKNN